MNTLDNALSTGIDGEEMGPIAAQLVIELSYQGTVFSGFARQPQQLTVQGELERALATLMRREALTVCAGRTDAGVHARQQVVSTPLMLHELECIDLYRLRRGLDALLHHHIQIRALSLARPSFSARFSVDRRRYVYRLCHATTRPLVGQPFMWHHPGNYDIFAMQTAAQYLVGVHDFTAFCKAVSARGKNTVREIYQVTVEEEIFANDPCIAVTVEGNAFLHSMIRIIVGSLVEVGRKAQPPDWIDVALKARQRSCAGPTAPPQGLMFDQVTYKPGLFSTQDQLLAEIQ